MIDFIISLIGLVAFSPLFLILMLAIKIDSPGPVLFKQKRVGIHKTHFYILKFRTMRIDTPKDIPTHMLASPEQYITKVGKFLRKTSLDEIPQIVNILKGDMSIIGPRPALWNQYDLLEERDKYGANDVLPGLTGWAQINGRDELEIPVKAKLDGEYVEKMSFAFDIKCFVGTILSVLRSDGVVEGGTGRMQKFLIITNHSYMLWQFRRELIAELQTEGEVVISMPFVGHEDDFKEMGCRCIETYVDRRGINPKTDLKLFKTYKKLLVSEKPDVVITYSIKPNIYAGFACRTMGIPYCVNVQGLGTAFQKEPIATIVTGMYKIALKRAKTVFFENKANATEFVRRGIIQESQITILNGAGVNLEVYEQQPYPSETDGIHLLFLGRIMKEKGVDELFVAAKNLKNKYGDKVVFDLVGFFEDEYKEIVEQLEKDKVVVFHGFQSEPRHFYNLSHCVVLPSYHEGMSNVLLEAAATGRALITSDIPGCHEAVDEGVNGFLCERMNAESLEVCIEKFLSLTLEAREQMGCNGRKKMEKMFDKKDVVRKTASKVLAK